MQCFSRVLETLMCISQKLFCLHTTEKNVRKQLLTAYFKSFRKALVIFLGFKLLQEIGSSAPKIYWSCCTQVAEIGRF